MSLVGRRTFVTELTRQQTSHPFLDYYVEGEFVGSEGRIRRAAPAEAPGRFYTVTLI